VARRFKDVMDKILEEKKAAPRESAKAPPAAPTPRAEPEQPVVNVPANETAIKARLDDWGLAGWTLPGWALPGLAGVLVAVLGIGGALLMTSGRPVVEAILAVPESVDSTRPCIHLPAELEAKVRQELTAGEQLLWGGQPSPRVTRVKGLAVAGVCSLLVLVAGAVATTVLALTEGPAIETWPLLAGCGLFILIGLAGMLLGPITQKRLAARTAYAITNRRAIVHRPKLFGATALGSYGPVQLQQMVRRDWWLVQGAGDLMFATQKPLAVHGSHGSSSNVREKIDRFGFLGIDEPMAVEKLLRQVLVNPLVDKIQASV
jgi:hypothetical protein